MDLYEIFRSMNEPYAAGLYEMPARSQFFRRSLAWRRYLEARPLMPYSGGPLYPAGRVDHPYLVWPGYMNINVDWNALRERLPAVCGELWNSEFFRYRSHVSPENTVAGDMWTHSMPCYERVLREGLDGYAERVAGMADRELREGLTELLSGIRAWHARCVAYLQEQKAPAALIGALSRVPFRPARNFYEALLSWNFVFYLDGCDNVGALPAGLAAYYEKDRPGAEKEAEDLLRAFYENVDENDGYSMAVGMVPTALDAAAIRAVNGRRRPMVELFVDKDTAPDVWRAALDSILCGSGQPAIYHRRLYREQLPARFPALQRSDMDFFCGGGCTESMIAGHSCVGSLDAGVNLPLIFERVMRACLPTAVSFEEFYARLMDEVRAVTKRTMEEVCTSQADRAAHLCAPMRTLLVEDCIAREKEYFSGGARYNWRIINFAGLVNFIDDVLAVRETVFETHRMTGAELVARLAREEEDTLAFFRNAVHRFGNDDPTADALAHRISRRVFSLTEGKMPFIGEGFLSASIQFQSYVQAGRHIGATPDGRRNGEALADSLTALFGRDTKGATALLRSVTSLDLSRALGTPVVNLTVSPDITPAALRALLEGYLGLGGMQIQISCLRRETLEKAMRDPGSYKNLVVRVGGYSEYFYRLPPELKQKVIERTIHRA